MIHFGSVLTLISYVTSIGFALPNGPSDAPWQITCVGPDTDLCCQTQFLNWYRQQPGVSRVGRPRIVSDDTQDYGSDLTQATHVCADNRPATMLQAGEVLARGRYHLTCNAGNFIRIFGTLGNIPRRKGLCYRMTEHERLAIKSGLMDCADIASANKDWLSLDVNVAAWLEPDVSHSQQQGNQVQARGLMSWSVLDGSKNEVHIELDTHALIFSPRQGQAYRVCARGPVGKGNLIFNWAVGSR